MVPSWVNSSGARSGPPSPSDGGFGSLMSFLPPATSALGRIPPGSGQSTRGGTWLPRVWKADGAGCRVPPQWLWDGVFLWRGTRFPSKMMLWANSACGQGGEGPWLRVLGETEARHGAEPGSALACPWWVAGTWLCWCHRLLPVLWRQGRAGIWVGGHRGPHPAWLFPAVPSGATIGFPALAAWHEGGICAPMLSPGPLGTRHRGRGH